MLPKPKHLGPEYAAQFADRSVVTAYRHRPPYPAEVFDVLAGLIAATPHPPARCSTPAAAPATWRAAW